MVFSIKWLILSSVSLLGSGAQLLEGLPEHPPYPSRKTSWLEQEVLGSGVWGEESEAWRARTCLASLHHANRWCRGPGAGGRSGSGGLLPVPGATAPCRFTGQARPREGLWEIFGVFRTHFRGHHFCFCTSLGLGSQELSPEVL